MFSGPPDQCPTAEKLTQSLAIKVAEATDRGGGDIQAAWNLVIAAYLDGDISLGRTAELLGVSRFEIAQSFNQVGIALQLGPATVEEAQAELESVRGRA